MIAINGLPRKATPKVNAILAKISSPCLVWITSKDCFMVGPASGEKAKNVKKLWKKAIVGEFLGKQDESELYVMMHEARKRTGSNELGKVMSSESYNRVRASMGLSE